MNISLVVLFAILIAGAGALVVWFALRCLDSSKYRNIILAVTVIATSAMIFLFCMAATLPDKVNELLHRSSAEIEQQIEMFAPGKTNEVLGIDELKSLLANTRQFSSFEKIDGMESSLIVRIIASNSIGDGLERLCADIETEIALFEQTGNSVTIRNVLDYLILRTEAPVRKATEILEIVILVVSLLCFIALSALIWAVRNGYFSDGSKGVIFGDEQEKEPETGK